MFLLACAILMLADDPASKHIPGRLGSKELSPAVVKAIHAWLDVEGIMAEVDRPPELPRRVIEVTTDESTPCRLHRSGVGERAAYATLSYCWGSTGAQQLTTTSSNLAD